MLFQSVSWSNKIFPAKYQGFFCSLMELKDSRQSECIILPLSLIEDMLSSPGRNFIQGPCGSLLP